MPRLLRSPSARPLAAAPAVAISVEPIAGYAAARPRGLEALLRSGSAGALAGWGLLIALLLAIPARCWQR